MILQSCTRRSAWKYIWCERLWSGSQLTDWLNTTASGCAKDTCADILRNRKLNTHPPQYRRCHLNKLLDLSLTLCLLACPSSRKSSWQLRQKRTSLPIWVSSTLSLGRETRRTSLLLPGWMISCVCTSVHPICLPFCGLETAFHPCSVPPPPPPLRFHSALHARMPLIMFPFLFLKQVNTHHLPCSTCLSSKCSSHWHNDKLTYKMLGEGVPLALHRKR